MARDEVCDARPGFHGPAAGHAIGKPGDAHQPAHGLKHRVVARVAAVGARLPESGDGAVDDPGLDGLDGGVVQPMAGQVPHLEVLDDDVAPDRERCHDVTTVWCGEVDRDRALVAVRAQIHRGFLGVVTVAVLEERGSPAARLVAVAGPFDLDHVGAEVAQRLCGQRSGQNPAEVQHADACQWKPFHRFRRVSGDWESATAPPWS